MRARPYPSLPAGPPGGAPLLCGGVPPSADCEGRRRTVQTPTGRQRVPRPGSDGGTLVGAAAVTAGSPEVERVGPRHAGPERAGAGDRGAGRSQLGDAGLGRTGLDHAGSGHARPDYAGSGHARPGRMEPSAVPGVPIFVDASGRRRKLARRASVTAVAVLAGYAGLLAVSFAGGPIPPKALLPVPGIPSGKAQSPASSAHAAPSASGSIAGQAGQSSAGATDHPSGTRGTKPGGSPGQSAPSEPSPTAASSVAPPSPTGTTIGTTSGNTHGNPTPPGHTRRKAPAPSQTS
jgi:hypothetical protein